MVAMGIKENTLSNTTTRTARHAVTKL